MEPDLRQRMLDYYNERAPEYEQAYTLGTGTSSISDPNVFKTEATTLAGIVHQFGKGRMIDIACGTGYWLPHYADHCSHITLFDQSERMLEQCREKVERFAIADRCTLVQGDLFEHAFGRGTHDSALIGFLLSHLTEEQEPRLFDVLRTVLAGSSGRFLILDSAWSAERAKFNAKVERQPRRLNDGTSFEIYKRYCDRDDIAAWESKYGVTVRVEHFGTAFFAVSGCVNAA